MTREHGVVHGLVLTPNEVAVEVHVQVVEVVAPGERHVGVDVVDIERVSRHLEVGRAQRLGAVRERMHEQVLRLLEVTNVAPGKDAAHRQHVTVVDHVLGAVLDVLVHVIGDHKVAAVAHLMKTA